MKRFVSIILLVLLCFSLQTTIFAASKGPPYLSVDSVTAVSGGPVKVNVYLSNNPGIISACLHVAFDSDLTLIKAENGNVFPSSMTFIMPKQLTDGGQITSDCNFAWQGLKIQDGEIKDGIVLSLIFTVSDNSKVGDIFNVTISSREGDVVSKSLSKVMLSSATGKITVASGASELEGVGENQNTSISIFDWLRRLIVKIKEIFSQFVKA